MGTNAKKGMVMIMERKSIGSFIAALRRANGMTQQELADKLNVSNKAVSRWERDETLPDLTIIPAIAEIFGVTCDELLRGEPKGAYVPSRSQAENAVENDAEAEADTAARAEARAMLKGERRAAAIVNRALSRFKTANIISAALPPIGVIFIIISNLVPSVAMYTVTYIVYPVSLIASVIVSVLALMRLRDSCGVEIGGSCDTETVARYERTMINFSHVSFGAALASLLYIIAENFIYYAFFARGYGIVLIPSYIAIVYLLKGPYAMLLMGRKEPGWTVSARARVFNITAFGLTVLAASTMASIFILPVEGHISDILRNISAVSELLILIAAIIYVAVERDSRVRAVICGIWWVLVSVGIMLMVAPRYAIVNQDDVVIYSNVNVNDVVLGITLVFVTSAVYRAAVNAIDSKKK